MLSGVRVENGRGPLGDGREHLHDIHDLVGFLVQACGRSLTGEYEQGGSIHVGVRDPGDEIRGAGPQGSEADGGIAGEAAVDFGHEGGALFVPRQHEFDLPRLLQGDHEIGVLFSGDAEDVFDSLGFETLNEEIRSFHGGDSLHEILEEEVWIVAGRMQGGLAAALSGRVGDWRAGPSGRGLVCIRGFTVRARVGRTVTPFPVRATSNAACGCRDRSWTRCAGQ
jgi:hypothetical protein